MKHLTQTKLMFLAYLALHGSAFIFAYYGNPYDWDDPRRYGQNGQ